MRLMDVVLPTSGWYFAVAQILVLRKCRMVCQKMRVKKKSKFRGDAGDVLLI